MVEPTRLTPTSHDVRTRDGRPRAPRLAVVAAIVAATVPVACSEPSPLSPQELSLSPGEAQTAFAEAQAASLPAFPGAEGWGAAALNECRSKPVEVLPVTNTNSSGPGSLTDALDNARSDRFTFIVFRTGGRIVGPRGGMEVSSNCVYVAGQTAPGDGVVIEGLYTGMRVRSRRDLSDVVMRYLRFRGRHGQTGNNLVIARGDRIVLDHMSFSWSDNYLLAIMHYGGIPWSGPISNVSVQRSIISEAFASHPVAFMVSATHTLTTAPSVDMTNISILGNLLAHSSHRNPLLSADNAVLANNVFYNWRIAAGMMKYRGTVDWINNYAKPGPMTRSDFRYTVNPYCNDFGADFSIYASGNTSPTAADAAGNNWSGDNRQVACYLSTGSGRAADVPTDWRRDEPQIAAATFSDAQALFSATDAYTSLLDDVGANARLTCEGDWVAALDDVDDRVISETQAGTGVSGAPANEGAVGGLPSYSEGSPCKDTDTDGLPNAWESRYAECVTCADPATAGEDGYLLIEHYVNGTDPQ